MTVERTLADRVKYLRERSNMLQAEVAAKIGISVSTYSNIETGYAPSTKLKTVIALADVFGVSVDFLLGRVDDTETADGTYIIDPRI